MSAVPRKSEAFVGGLERARLGASAANARQGSARATALAEALSQALEHVSDPAGLAEWCTLAAANLDMAAKPLLEAFAQGGRGPLRTRAWIMRNGARIEKGERGLAVSMFGGYVWPLRATTGRFGGVGLVSDGPVTADELEGWRGIVAGDAIAAAILCAMRGSTLSAVIAAGVVDLERLDVALARARGVAWQLPSCLSCGDAGCVLCSCLDGANRQAVLDCEAMPATPEPDRSVAAKPRRSKAKPALPDVEAAMREVRRLRSVAADATAKAAELERAAMVQAWANHSLADIAAASGVSRQRVHQIVNRD